MTESAPLFDLVTTGRIGVDLDPLRSCVSQTLVQTFGKFLGGSAANVAVAAARSGRSSAMVIRTGADPSGGHLHQALEEFGVDDRRVTPVEGPPTPVTFCELFPPDDFPLSFYRQSTTPDLRIRTDELDFSGIRSARVRGSLCHSPLSGWELERTMRYANAAGALGPVRRIMPETRGLVRAAARRRRASTRWGSPRASAAERGGVGNRRQHRWGSPLWGRAWQAPLTSADEAPLLSSDPIRRTGPVASRLACSSAMPTRSEVDDLLASGSHR